MASESNSYVRCKTDSNLIAAVITGNEECVKLLLAHGAEVNYRNERGESPLDLARRYAPHLVPILETASAMGPEDELLQALATGDYGKVSKLLKAHTFGNNARAKAMMLCVLKNDTRGIKILPDEWSNAIITSDEWEGELMTRFRI